MRLSNYKSCVSYIKNITTNVVISKINKNQVAQKPRKTPVSFRINIEIDHLLILLWFRLCLLIIMTFWWNKWPVSLDNLLFLFVVKVLPRPPLSPLPRPYCHIHCTSLAPFWAPSSGASQRSPNKREERASATWTGLHPSKILQSSWPAAP